MPRRLETSDTPLAVVIVSPHFDDGALSLGASMAAWARLGHHVTLLTVLGCDRESEDDAGGWDRRAGFATERDAARGRREEDRHACALLGVSSLWFPFGSSDYERHATDDEVWRAISPPVEAADVVLGPGFPLTHPDHSWLAALLAARLGADRVGHYAEQPYALKERALPFARLEVSLRDRIAKWRAVRAYRSQLPLLGMSPVRGVARMAQAEERIALPAAWVGSAAS